MTGVGRYVLSMIEALARLEDPPRITALINTNEGWKSPVNLPGVEFKIVDADLQSHPFGDLKWQNEAPLITSQIAEPDDVFWGPAFQVPWKKSFPCRRIVTLHDMAAWLYPATIPWKFRKYLHYVEKKSATVADTIIAVSQATAAHAHHCLGVPSENIKVIQEGPLLRSDDTEDSPPAEFNHHENFALFVGALEPRKNVDLLIEVFEILEQRNDPTQLVLCGPPGWKNESTLQRLQTSPASNRIHRLSYVELNELRWLYKNARILLMPSLHEGFGLPPLEAATLGTPSLVSGRGSLPEVAIRKSDILPLHAETWANTISEFSPPTPEEIKQHAKRFSWDKAARELVYLFSQ